MPAGNIPHEFGRRAIEYFVSYYRQSINSITTQFILEAESFTLSNNSMTFDEMCYLQMQGCEIGTIFPPTYATFSMGFHEIELHAIIRNKLTLLFTSSTFSFYKFTIFNKVGKDF